MKIYDISMTISKDMMVYKDKASKKPKVVTIAKHETEGYHETDITMNLHTGTHIDAPLHMIAEGNTTDAYPIEQGLGKALVIDMTHVTDRVEQTDLESYDLSQVDFVLLKTRNSFEDFFNQEFIALGKSGAIYLSQLPLKGVGIDALGIERAQPDKETHRSLLRQGIMIIEGLRLKAITPGVYDLVILPLKLQQVEGAPARAILIERV